MNPLNETLAADPGTEIATGALPQSTVVPIDNEPAPTLIVEPPLPGPLAPNVATRVSEGHSCECIPECKHAP